MLEIIKEGIGYGLLIVVNTVFIIFFIRFFEKFIRGAWGDSLRKKDLEEQK